MKLFVKKQSGGGWLSGNHWICFVLIPRLLQFIVLDPMDVNPKKYLEFIDIIDYATSNLSVPYYVGTMCGTSLSASSPEDMPVIEDYDWNLDGQEI
uniref:Uncharacterized protein n=1 Tax=Leersia perrieri TaxID=77586 RepID=A0A0D9XRR3_9ORYZ